MSAILLAFPPRRRFTSDVLAAAAFLACLAGAGFAQARSEPMTPPAAATPPPTGDALRPVERTFLERATQLSNRQIRLAQLGASRAVNSEVRSYAQQVASDTRQISDALDGLRRRKSPSLGEPPVVASEALDRLTGRTGADFDRDFVRLGGELHNQMLRLFEEVIADAKDDDVRALIGTYLPVLRDHQNRGVELQKTFD